MVVLDPCKNKDVPIKNEDARVVTNLYFDFSDVQGQLNSIVSGGIQTHPSFYGCPCYLQE